ncbi:N-formylglutamate amidohydrolase [Novipirellula caenicola]|uniref:N-formylglutamate amidohydrolase n=1 Tax=Novipirellula caenicola TaxID=1536901 RepID=A0ABP9VNB5_9BACT
MTILISCEMGGELVPPWLVRQPMSSGCALNSEVVATTQEISPDHEDSAAKTSVICQWPRCESNSGGGETVVPAIAREDSVAESPAMTSSMASGGSLAMEAASVMETSSANEVSSGKQDHSQCSGGKLVFGRFPEKLPGDDAARYVARRMAKLLQSPIIENKYTSALIDVTRSARHRSVMPAEVRKWPREVRDRLIQEVHADYRNRVQAAIEQNSRRHGFTIHVSVRSFALKSEGRLRRTDVGLLYDPSREDEMAFCLDWIDEMYDLAPMIRVRRNYPRRGTTESLVTAMRSHFTADDYIGVELLLNRAWAGRRVALRDQAIEGICKSLDEVLEFQAADAA